jgi:hypothetical protein
MHSGEHPANRDGLEILLELRKEHRMEWLVLLGALLLGFGFLWLLYRWIAYRTWMELAPADRAVILEDERRQKAKEAKWRQEDREEKPQTRAERVLSETGD